MADAAAHKRSPAVPAIMAGYGIFLAATGTFGAYQHGFTPKVMHSMYAGLGCGGAVLGCAGMAAMPSSKAHSIGVHLGLLVNFFLAGLFTFQAVKSAKDPAKADRLPLFIVMAAGSGLSLTLLYLLKPKSAKKTQ